MGDIANNNFFGRGVVDMREEYTSRKRLKEEYAKKVSGAPNIFDDLQMQRKANRLLPWYPPIYDGALGQPLKKPIKGLKRINGIRSYREENQILGWDTGGRPREGKVGAMNRLQRIAALSKKKADKKKELDRDRLYEQYKREGKEVKVLTPEDTAQMQLADFYFTKGDIDGARKILVSMMVTTEDDDLKANIAKTVMRYGLDTIKLKHEMDAGKVEAKVPMVIINCSSAEVAQNIVNI